MAIVALAERVGSNKQFRDHLATAGKVAAYANVRARLPFERFEPARQLACDAQLHEELAQLAQELRGAWDAIRSDQAVRSEFAHTARQFRRGRMSGERKRNRWKLQNPWLVPAAAGALAAIVAARASRLRSQTQNNFVAQEHSTQSVQEQTQQAARA